MNATRTFLISRATAIVAQLQDKGPFDFGILDVNARVRLRLEYLDVKRAMLAMHVDPIAHPTSVLKPIETLWAEHCFAHQLPLEHGPQDITG